MAAELDRLRELGYTQRETARDLRLAITEALAAGCTWSDIGRALHMTRETAYRQYKAGSPIVVIRPYQKGWKDREAGLAELTRLGQEIDDGLTWVCVTHSRFIPCRGGRNNCVLSAAPESVEAVRRYHSGGNDHDNA